MIAKRETSARRSILVSLSWAGLALALAAGLAACQPQTLAVVEDVTLNSQDPFVAFLVDSGDDGGDLYVFDPVAGTTTQLTRGNRVHWDVSSPGVEWSPDGDYVSIEALRGSSGGEELYLLNAGTGDLTNLTARLPDFDAIPDAEIAHPAWSPVDNMLAFGFVPPLRVNVPREGPARLFLADAASSDLTEVDLAGSGADAGRLDRIAWSPDGQQLAFEGASGIYVANIQTGEVRYLIEGAEPAWSPDGTEIAYSAVLSDDGFHVYVISAAGGDPRPVMDQPGSFATPVWSPDGQYLAFIESIPDEFGGVIDQTLYITDFSETWLATNDIDTVRWPLPPVWSPDSSTLVFADYGAICWAAVAGGEPDCPVPGVYPILSGDTQWLAYVTTSATNTPKRLCVRPPDGEEVCTEEFDESIFPLGWRP